MGDYVDRGPYGPEVCLYLLALKIKFPNDIIMLRGNHESREMTQQFNFYDQMMAEYDVELYDMLMDAFDLLPIACLVCSQYLCMHGGISRHMTTLDSINKIDRRMEPPEDGLLCDMLWADPADSKKCGKDWVFNEKRCISVVFGRRPLNALLEKEGLKCIIRAHEVKQKGYKFHLWHGKDEFPPVITVFSAPNYSNSDNQASVLITDGENVDIRTFAERKDKPFILPERTNAFKAF